MAAVARCETRNFDIVAQQTFARDGIVKGLGGAIHRVRAFRIGRNGVAGEELPLIRKSRAPVQNGTHIESFACDLPLHDLRRNPLCRTLIVLAPRRVNVGVAGVVPESRGIDPSLQPYIKVSRG